MLIFETKGKQASGIAFSWKSEKKRHSLHCSDFVKLTLTLDGFLTPGRKNEQVPFALRLLNRNFVPYFKN